MKYQELRDAVSRYNNGMLDGDEWINRVRPAQLAALLADADKGEELKGCVQAFVMVLPLLAEAADIDLNETAIKFSANDKPLASISLQECIEKARAALSQGEQT